MSTVVVLGATGAQGGSVAKRLAQNPKYKVRAVTRDASSEKAKALASQGMEVVNGDVNEKESLGKAFEGADAIFVVTAYWPSIPTLGRDGAGEEEVQQFKNIADAAAATPSLKHLVLSTLPPCDTISAGKLKVPHYDYKQKAVEWIKANHADLWAKTTEFWPGWYTSNLLTFPFLAFSKPAGAYAYIQMLPSSPSGILPIAGNLEHNAGVVVEGILEKGSAAHGKVAILITDYLSQTAVAAKFQEVTGQPAAFVEVSDETIGKMFGDFGLEAAAQFRWSESYPDWHAFQPKREITLKELGVEGKLIDFEGALSAMKDQLVNK